MNFIPPPLVSMAIWLAPASSEFSTNSLTTEAGFSTTPPTAILAATLGLKGLVAMSNLVIHVYVYFIKRVSVKFFPTLPDSPEVF
jgi:hypothetical protein